MTPEESMKILVRNRVVMKVMIRIMIMAPTTTTMTSTTMTTTSTTTSSTTNSIRRIRNQCRIYGQQGCGGDINNHGRCANVWFCRRCRRRHRTGTLTLLNWGWVCCFSTLFCFVVRVCLGRWILFTVFSQQYKEATTMNDQIVMHIQYARYQPVRNVHNVNTTQKYPMFEHGEYRFTGGWKEYQRDIFR
jgi:hypothetical protein